MTEDEKLRLFLEQSGDQVDDFDFNDMSESLDSSGEAVNPSSGETIYQEDYKDLQGVLNNKKGLLASNDYTDTMNDAGGGLPVSPDTNNNYRIPASMDFIPGLPENSGGPGLMPKDWSKDATPINPGVFTGAHEAWGHNLIDEPKKQVPKPITRPEQTPQGSSKVTVKSNRFNPTPFKPSSGGYAPMAYQEPTLAQTTQDDDKDANRQRLLAYLGMGTQDAITGMTGFQGNTNVYDQMILAANQKKKAATSRQDKINNFIKQRNAFRLAEQGQAQRGRIAQGNLEFRVHDADQKNKVETNKAQMKLESDNDKDVSGTKRLNNIMAAGWNVYTDNGQGEATAIAIEEFKRGVKLLQSDPNFQPDRLRNWLKSYSSLLPGEAKKLYPAMFALRQQVETALLPALKPTFGGAFTEGEGAKLDNTGFDPELTPEANIRAMNNWARRLSAGYAETQRKMRYYSKNGYNMAGYTLQAPVTIERAEDE